MMDEGLVAHWVSLIFQGKLGMRGTLCILHPLALGSVRDEGLTAHWVSEG